MMHDGLDGKQYEEETNAFSVHYSEGEDRKKQIRLVLDKFQQSSSPIFLSIGNSLQIFPGSKKSLFEEIESNCRRIIDISDVNENFIAFKDGETLKYFYAIENDNIIDKISSKREIRKLCVDNLKSMNCKHFRRKAALQTKQPRSASSSQQLHGLNKKMCFGVPPAREYLETQVSCSVEKQPEKQPIELDKNKRPIELDQNDSVILPNPEKRVKAHSNDKRSSDLDKFGENLQSDVVIENQQFNERENSDCPVDEKVRNDTQINNCLLVERKKNENENTDCREHDKVRKNGDTTVDSSKPSARKQDKVLLNRNETSPSPHKLKERSVSLSKTPKRSPIFKTSTHFKPKKKKKKIVTNKVNEKHGAFVKEFKRALRETTNLPNTSSYKNDLWVYPIGRRNRRPPGNFSRQRQQLQQQVQQQQQQQQQEQQQLASSQQGEEQPRYPIQCTEGSEIQDRESRNYDIVTSTRPVFSEQDSATATNAPLPVTPTLNIPYAQERALLDRVQGQGQHGTATGGGRTTPRHPQYQDQTARQRSFTNWPASTHQAPARMIVFGFFYTGREDLVRCYHCGIGLKDWSDGDEPLFEHIKHAPNCLFLRQLLGEQLLNTYRENLAEAQRNNETARSQGSEPRPAQQPTRRVRHPGMTTLAQRLGTFNEWPQSTGQQPEALANAGLFFTGINDLCRCFTCDGGLQRWDGEDDPWLEHARWFPHCSYVREIKGQDYIDMVQAAAQRAQLEEEESVVVRGLTNLDFQNTDPIETEAAKAVLDMGYSRAAVRLAIHEFNGRNPSQRTLRFTADELVQILVGRQERGEPIPDDDNDPEEKGASASAAQNLPSDPMEENKRLKGILKCIDCKENDCNILLLPCTHHRLCEPCAEKVTNCPVCQRRVEERVRTYMA